VIKTVELSLCGLCNLRCSFCPRAHGYPNTNDHMSEETIDLICEHLGEIPYRVEVHLSGRGEPTLHNNFDMIVDKLKAVDNVFLHLVTNGKHWKKWESSCHKMDRVIYNVYTEEENDYWDAMEDIENHSGEVELLYKPDDGRTLLLTNRAGHVPLNIAPGQGYCFRPFEKIFINWNGDYVLCCEDWSDNPLTNITEQSIVQYYESNETLLEYKQALEQGKRINVCGGCSFPG